LKGSGSIAVLKVVFRSSDSDSGPAQRESVLVAVSVWSSNESGSSDCFHFGSCNGDSGSGHGDMTDMFVTVTVRSSNVSGSSNVFNSGSLNSDGGSGQRMSVVSVTGVDDGGGLVGNSDRGSDVLDDG